MANDRQMTLTPELGRGSIERSRTPAPKRVSRTIRTRITTPALAPSLLSVRFGPRPIWLFAYGSLIWKPRSNTLKSVQAGVGGTVPSAYGRPAGEVRKSSPA